MCNPVWELLSTGFEFIILGCTKGPEDNLLPYPSVAVDSDFKHSDNGKDQSWDPAPSFFKVYTLVLQQPRPGNGRGKGTAGGEGREERARKETGRNILLM